MTTTTTTTDEIIFANQQLSDLCSQVGRQLEKVHPHSAALLFAYKNHPHHAYQSDFTIPMWTLNCVSVRCLRMPSSRVRSLTGAAETKSQVVAYVCSHCGMWIDRYVRIVAHLRDTHHILTGHYSQEKRTLACSLCHVSLATHKEALAHLATAHGTQHLAPGQEHPDDSKDFPPSERDWNTEKAIKALQKYNGSEDTNENEDEEKAGIGSKGNKKEEAHSVAKVSRACKSYSRRRIRSASSTLSGSVPSSTSPTPATRTTLEMVHDMLPPKGRGRPPRSWYDKRDELYRQHGIPVPPSRKRKSTSDSDSLAASSEGEDCPSGVLEPRKRSRSTPEPSSDCDSSAVEDLLKMLGLDNASSVNADSTTVNNVIGAQLQEEDAVRGIERDLRLMQPFSTGCVAVDPVGPEHTVPDSLPVLSVQHIAEDLIDLHSVEADLALGICTPVSKTTTTTDDDLFSVADDASTLPGVVPDLFLNY